MTDPITTPAQMREAAARLIENLQTFLSHYADKDAWDGYPAMLRTMIADAETLRRALPGAKAAPVAVRVKKLVWVDADEGMCTKWRAAALGGHYELVILDKEDGLFSVNFRWGNPLGFWFIQGEPDQFGPTGPKKFPSIEAAQAAAEADHAARVLSQIDAVPASQVRAEALREAARECDKLAGDPQAVRVKPLVAGRHPRGFIATDHGGGAAYIFALNGGRYECIKGLAHSPRFDTSKEALAAAQADHDARVLSQIEAVPAAQVRAEALREVLADDEMCLRLAEGYDREDAAQRGEPSPHTMGDEGYAEWAADRIACAKEGLRALIEKEPT